MLGKGIIIKFFLKKTALRLKIPMLFLYFKENWDYALFKNIPN